MSSLNTLVQVVSSAKKVTTPIGVAACAVTPGAMADVNLRDELQP
jgi:hypothetical protein